MPSGGEFSAIPRKRLQHEGVQDALLADLDGDGQLELHVGFWGAEGIHCATLSGTTLWRNNDVSHVLSLMAPVASRWPRAPMGLVSQRGRHPPGPSRPERADGR